MARRGNPVAEAPKTVSVSLEGSRVGTAAMTPDGLMAFSYAPSWIEEGFSISPFSLPLAPGVRVAPPDPLEGVFGVIDDAMPDGWGRLLLDRSLRMQGVDPRSVGVLERLCLVGDGAMLMDRGEASWQARAEHWSLGGVPAENRPRPLRRTLVLLRGRRGHDPHP